MTLNYGKHTQDNRDRSAVHAYDPSFMWPGMAVFKTMCGRANHDVAYIVKPREFGKLMTPPAPWCAECSYELDGHGSTASLHRDLTRGAQ